MSLYCHWVLFKAKAVNEVADVTADGCDGGVHMSIDNVSPRSGEKEVAPVASAVAGPRPATAATFLPRLLSSCAAPLSANSASLSRCLRPRAATLTHAMTIYARF
jgi:hypothetical protein